MIPLWAIRYLLPGLGVLALGWAAYDFAYDRGVADERHTWQAARVELLRLRTATANKAGQQLAATSEAVPKAGIKEIIRVETHWRDRPVRDCFDPDLVRSLEEARATIRRSATTSTGNN